MKDAKRTFQIHTNISPVVCPDCGQGLSTGNGEKIDGAINHVLAHGGWQLIHIGGEWARDENGKSVQHTVAFLGHA